MRKAGTDDNARRVEAINVLSTTQRWQPELRTTVRLARVYTMTLATMRQMFSIPTAPAKRIPLACP